VAVMPEGNFEHATLNLSWAPHWANLRPHSRVTQLRRRLAISEIPENDVSN